MRKLPSEASLRIVRNTGMEGYVGGGEVDYELADAPGSPLGP